MWGHTSLLCLFLLWYQLKSTTTKTYVKDLSKPYVFCYKFYSSRAYIQVFDPFWVNICVWYKGMVQFCSFALGSPVFPAPLMKETVFSPLFILGSFVIKSRTIDVCVYFWALSCLLVMCVSVFVTMLDCFDYSSFVISLKWTREMPLVWFFFL